MPTALGRFDTASFRMITLTCVFTVCRLMLSFSAISLFGSHCAPRAAHVRFPLAQLLDGYREIEARLVRRHDSG